MNVPLPDSSFPSLLTERLCLRQPLASDFAAFHALVSLPAVTRFSNWPDMPKAVQTERSLKWMCEVYAKSKGCAWVIQDRVSGDFMGGIRFNSIDKQAKFAEIGYELHPAFWRRGFATEAVNAAVKCGFSNFGLNRIEAWTLPGNQESDRVLEKAGFLYEGTLRQKAWFKNAFHDLRMFGRLANELA